MLSPIDRRRTVPLWIVLAAGVLLIGGAMTCRKEAADAINDASRWTSPDGLPLDWAGDGMQCPACDAGKLWHQSGYSYRCGGCGRTVQVRRDPQSATFAFEFSH